MYVYEIVQQLSERSAGKYSVSALYPVVYGLQEQGFVEVIREEEVARRIRAYYGITDAGKHYLQDSIKVFEELTKFAETILS